MDQSRSPREVMISEITVCPQRAKTRLKSEIVAAAADPFCIQSSKAASALAIFQAVV